ncbi:MAG: SDR family NAD(P)-dependent oxidoreductase [Gammaproteobacteria bacterium]
MTESPGKVAWITGGGTGIGRELALQLARHGWRVAVSGRTRSSLDEAVTAAGGLPGTLKGFVLDVTDEGACRGTAAAIRGEWGIPDLAVFNAGMYEPFKLDRFTPELMRRHMEVNYMGTVNCLASILDDMRQRGSGHLAITASVAGYRGLPLAAPYAASKAALISLAESLHLELAAAGIDITVINPGFVDTPLTSENRFHMPALMDAPTAGGLMYSGLMTRRFEITFPRRFTWWLKFLRILPYALYFPLIRRMTGR